MKIELSIMYWVMPAIIASIALSNVANAQAVRQCEPFGTQVAQIAGSPYLQVAVTARYRGRVYARNNINEVWKEHAVTSNTPYRRFGGALSMGSDIMIRGGYGVVRIDSNGQDHEIQINRETNEYLYDMDVCGERLLILSGKALYSWTKGSDSAIVVSTFGMIPFPIGFACSDTTYYVNTEFNQLYSSDDHGASWSLVPLPDSITYIVATIALDSGLLVLAEGTLGYLSGDDNTWIIEKIDADERSRSIFVNDYVEVGDRQYVATSNGLRRYDPALRAWIRVEGVLGNQQIWDLDLRTARDLAATTDEGVYTSTDSGQTWYADFTGICSEKIIELESCGRVLCLVPSGLFAKEPLSDDWTYVNVQNPQSTVNTMAASGQNIVLLTDSSLNVSRDCGRSFSFSGEFYRLGVQTYWVNLIGDTVLVGIGNGVAVSYDLGESWRVFLTSDTCSSGANGRASIICDRIVLASSCGVLSIDMLTGDVNAYQVGAEEKSVGSISRFGSSLVCISGDTVYLSRDCGEHWKSASNGLIADLEYVNLTFVQGARLYIGTRNGRIYQWNPSTEWWLNIIELPEPSDINSFAIAPNGAYIGTTEDGLWLSPSVGVEQHESAVTERYGHEETSTLVMHDSDDSFTVPLGTSPGELMYANIYTLEGSLVRRLAIQPLLRGSQWFAEVPAGLLPNGLSAVIATSNGSVLRSVIVLRQ